MSAPDRTPREAQRQAQAQALVRAASLFRAEPSTGWLRHLAAGVLMALFVVTVLVALGAGVTAYGTVFNTGQEADQARLAGPLLANVVRGNDYAGAVSSQAGPEGPVLVLTQSTSVGSYDTRLYLYQGQLMQDYVLSGAPVDPSRAEALLPTQSFTFAARDGRLVLTTDQGSVAVALRSGGSQGGQ